MTNFKLCNVKRLAFRCLPKRFSRPSVAREPEHHVANEEDNLQLRWYWRGTDWLDVIPMVEVSHSAAAAVPSITAFAASLTATVVPVEDPRPVTPEAAPAYSLRDPLDPSPPYAPRTLPLRAHLSLRKGRKHGQRIREKRPATATGIPSHLASV